MIRSFVAGRTDESTRRLAHDRKSGESGVARAVSVGLGGVMTNSVNAISGGLSAANFSAGRAIGWAGVVCGVLDINAAFTNAYLAAGMTPARVLQAVASGLLGAQSYQLGATSAAFGLALHFCVAFGWTVIFYAVSRKVPALLQRPVVTGLVYGALVYLLMNIAVLPFASWFRSLYLHTPVVFAPRLAWAQLLIHLACVGLPIVLIVRKFSR